jgi:hypothetical protein
MRIYWVLAEQLQLPPKYTSQDLHAVAPIWASWRLWRSYQVDNCICGDIDEAEFCLQYQFNQFCNLYVPDSVKTPYPRVIKFASGSLLTFSHANDIISMFLAGVQSDLVLLLGFHNINVDNSYGQAFRATINNLPDTQWVNVSVDGSANTVNLQNYTCDKLDNVVKLLQ